MRTNSIVKQLESVEYIFELAYGANNEEEYDGHCPCASFTLTDGKGTVYAHSRCWRVSDSMDDGYQDLYVWGEHPDLKAVAETLKHELDNTKWYNPYTIIYEEFK